MVAALGMLWDMIALRCLTKECVLLLENVFSYYALGHDRSSLPYERMCSLTIECVFLLCFGT